MENGFVGPRVAIDETEKYYEKQSESVGEFKTQQNRLLTALSLIISMAGLLIGTGDGFLVVPSILVVLIGVMFIIEVFINLVLIMPVELEAPFKPDYKNFKNLFFEKTEQKVLENKLENYIITIANNREKVSKLYWLSWISTAYFMMILLTLFYILVVMII